MWLHEDWREVVYHGRVRFDGAGHDVSKQDRDKNGRWGDGGRPDDADRFRDDLSKSMTSLRSVVQPIKVCKTTEVLRRLGAPDLDVTISRDVVRKATNGVKHHVPMSVIQALPEQIASPVMVFKSKTEQGSLVVLTEFNDAKGDPVIAAIHLSKQVGQKIEVNEISSVYGKGPGSKISEWIGSGLLLYAHKEKSRTWLTDRGLQLPKAQIQGGKGSVLTDDDFVKSSAIGVQPGSIMDSTYRKLYLRYMVQP